MKYNTAKTLSILGVIFGAISWFILGWLLGLTAIVFGILVLCMDESHDHGNKVRAIWSIVLFPAGYLVGLFVALAGFSMFLGI